MPSTKNAVKNVVYGVDLIGQTAGDVWQFLNTTERVSFTQLSKEVDAPRDLVMQAVGWLAREGKIAINENGRTRTVSLS